MVKKRKDGARPSDEDNWRSLTGTSWVTRRDTRPRAVFSSGMVVGLLEHTVCWEEKGRNCPQKPAASKVIRKAHRSQPPCNKHAYLVAADVHIQALLIPADSQV